MPWRQDLNVIFLHLCPVASWMGDRPLSPPIFENFSIQHMFLKFCFFNIKMKKGLRCVLVAEVGPLGDPESLDLLEVPRAALRFV